MLAAMKALYFNEHGDIDKLQFGDLPRPQLLPGHAIIKVRAAALNHLDLWVLNGWPSLKLEMPHIGGADIAGEIVEIGEDNAGWEVGKKVIVNPGFVATEDQWTKRDLDSLSPNYKILGEDVAGGFAEYVSVPIKNLYPLFKGLSFEEAAAPLLVGLTSWRMLFTRGELEKGQTVLIVGSGGGVNSFSAQMAKAAGAKVILLGSTEKLKKAEQLGADHLIDYKKTPDWSKEVQKLTDKEGVDLVVDNVGAATVNQSIKSLRRGGKLITVGNTSGPELKIDNRYLFTKQISLIGSTMGSKRDFEEMLGFVCKHKIKPLVDSSYPLADGKEAYRKMHDGNQFGKIVLIP